MSSYELVTLDDGTTARQYTSDKPGTYRSDEAGKGGQYLRRHPDSAPVITSELGREYALRRRELREQEAEQACVDAVQEATGLQNLTAEHAYGLLAGEAMKSGMANMIDKPSDAVKVSKFALELAGIAPGDKQASAPSVTIHIDDATFNAIKQVDDVIEGEWVSEASEQAAGGVDGAS